MIGIAITWEYTTEHHFDKEFNANLDRLVKDLCMSVPAEDDGVAGGTLFDAGEWNSDSTRYFIVPNMECAKQIQRIMDGYLKTWDSRYEARLEISNPPEEL